ncbi:hypothetical protein ACFL0X_02780, partial [Nanoarchaeota archaeon]
MKNFMKIILILIALFAVLTVLFLLFFPDTITGGTVSNRYSYTKAICNDSNYCSDHLIVCENDKLVSMDTITGASIQFSEDWKDSRVSGKYFWFCEY